MFQNYISSHIVFTLISNVSTDPEFLAGGGRYSYSSPADSIQGLGVLQQRKKLEAALNLLFPPSAALLLFSALFPVQDNSQQQHKHLPRTHEYAPTAKHSLQFKKLKTENSLFHII